MRPNASAAALYYRGRAILGAVVDDLKAKHNLAAATDVVVSGCSAGAIHIYAHMDHVRRMLPQTARVVGFADSGFYMDVDMFTPLKAYVVSAAGQNATAMLRADCKSEHPGQEEKCLVASVVASMVETPLFAWQSAYDHDQRGCEMSPKCAQNRTCVNEYGANLTASVFSSLLQPGNSRNGVFLDACTRHCTGFGPDWPEGTIGTQVDGSTPLQALSLW